MHDIKELQRLASPAAKPQALAWDGKALWMGSLATQRLYAINPTTWTVSWETPAPGKPWGMTACNGELRVICSEGAEDHRVILRCVPGSGFDAKFRIPCPDYCGAQLGWDGQRLHVSQWYPKKVLGLGKAGKVERVIMAPHGICGQVIVDDIFYLVTTDAEETNEYFLTRIDARSGPPQWEDIARIPFAARALAFDGKNFWTNHREQNQIVSFARP
ncbi:MAG: hypothetical protein PSU94_03705 [Lacunisphaera sp.]|nr:hypothetical protein [Lacunisphaera sp.]